MLDEQIFTSIAQTILFLLDIDLEVFFEATEDWNSAMTLSNSMAFISQFGEVRF